MHVVHVNYGWDSTLRDPAQLLDRYVTLTGWNQALVDAGVRVTVVQRFGAAMSMERGGVQYLFRRGREMNGATAEAGGDLVHVNGLVFPIRTLLLRRVVGAERPLVLQDHAAGDPPARGPMSPRHSIRRRALAAADAFLFAAAEQADAWRRHALIAPTQPVFEVMEAAPALRPIDRARARRTTGISGSPALLWVGRLNANKDPLTVLDGFERAAPRLGEATLTMVYREDDLLVPVTRRVRESAELRERVRLAGAVRHDRLAAFYSAADLFVAGSRHEGSGYALLEACACGAVPVVTDIPSFRAITDRGRLGALWPHGDADALARALVDVTSRDLAGLSAAVRAHVERRFSWSAIAAGAISAYSDIIARKLQAAPRREGI